jgi:iron(III) transport system substrate-binding protein
MLRNSRDLPTRWMNVRQAVTALVAVSALVGLSACTPTSAAPENVIAQGKYPAYYPDDYSDLVDAAEAEGGELTIYSNIDEENWTPIFRDFKKKYPFVTSIAANNLDSDEIFQRVLSEEATNGSPADIIVSGAAQGWAEYVQEEDAVATYESPEVSELPDFAELLPNVYALSMDPMGLLYNTQLIEEPITGFESLAEVVEADPSAFANKISSRDVGSSFGFTVSEALTTANPDAWDALETLLPQARAETSSGTQTDKLLAGEYEAAFILSAAVGYPAEERSGGLVKFVLPDDGTVLVPRGVAVGPSAPHEATAKLFVDFVLSEEGQAAVSEGGLTSYRDSVEAAEGRHTYQEVMESVGEKAVIVAKYEQVATDAVTEFTTKWNGLLG